MNAPDAIELILRLRTLAGLNSRIESVAMREAADHITALTAERDAAVMEAKAYWYRQGKDDGVQHEREDVIRWLRKEAIMSTDTVRRRMNKALDQIAAGAHKETTNDD
jgi:hypothetical protein